MRVVAVSSGISWVEVPEADLRVLCGCPADSVKHLMLGERSGKRFRLGDRLRVKLVRADLESGRVDFVLAAPDPSNRVPARPVEAESARNAIARKATPKARPVVAGKKAAAPKKRH